MKLDNISKGRENMFKTGGLSTDCKDYKTDFTKKEVLIDTEDRYKEIAPIVPVKKKLVKRT